VFTDRPQKVFLDRAKLELVSSRPAGAALV
jgi:hypothetical protein